jgi:hypothetical protein
MVECAQMRRRAKKDDKKQINNMYSDLEVIAEELFQCYKNLKENLQLLCQKRPFKHIIHLEPDKWKLHDSILEHYILSLSFESGKFKLQYRNLNYKMAALPNSRNVKIEQNQLNPIAGALNINLPDLISCIENLLNVISNKKIKRVVAENTDTKTIHGLKPVSLTFENTDKSTELQLGKGSSFASSAPSNCLDDHVEQRKDSRSVAEERKDSTTADRTEETRKDSLAPLNYSDHEEQNKDKNLSVATESAEPSSFFSDDHIELAKESAEPSSFFRRSYRAGKRIRGAFFVLFGCSRRAKQE